MKRRLSRLGLVGCAAAVFILLLGMDREGGLDEEFTRLPADLPDPSGNNVLRDCGGGVNPFSDAEASVKVRQRQGRSIVTITLEDGRPNTLYTVWLRLTGTDRDGNSFGASPVTGGGSTPLAPSWELDDLLAATGPGNGSAEVANGFVTDRRGDGRLHIALDFPLIGGAYPFHRFPDFDATDSRFPIADPRIMPVAIIGPDRGAIDFPFTLRIVSHCSDNLGHGLTPGVREPWFDWPR